MRVCLSMIVRDEARVIERCLLSCAGTVHALSVCDTGSTDATVEAVRRVAEARGLPLDVQRRPWIDFGTNRTEALGFAVEFVRRLGWAPSETWLLLLDADQILEVEGPVVLGGGGPGAEPADGYRLRQRNGDTVYWNTRLVRASLPWRYVGATHEYLATPAGAKVERLPALGVRDRNDGGARSDKFQRDLRLLSAALERDPTDPRTLFYLARTWRALGDPLKALTLFRRRIERGGWVEEVWHAWMASAEMLLERGDLRDARRAALSARRLLPSRAEAHHLLAQIHRAAGRPARAAAAAAAGLRRPFPADAGLFVAKGPYEHGLLEELALSAAGTRHRREGRSAAERLVRRRATPVAVKDRAHRALLAYAEPLSGATHVRLHPPLPEPWVPCNPCIVRRDDGYLVNCRAVNYRQRDARDYTVHDPDGVVRSRNLLLRLDGELRTVSATELYGEAPPPRCERIAGFEDARLLPTSHGLLAVVTTADRHPSGRVGPSLLRIDEDGRVRREVPLTGYGLVKVEKNWLPFLADDGRVRLHYGFEPLVVLDVDLETGVCRPCDVREAPFDLTRFRHSAGPVPLRTAAGPGSLFVVHEVVVLPERRRRYLHRFVWTPEVGADVWASPAFTLRALGIEFVAGLCRDLGGDRLLLSFGVEDREAWIASVPVEAVVRALAPLA